ncbi:MAG: hypothetical protein LBB36_06570 [Fibromonadaceae bacterium]|jgi:hypothetical protein|nr:hypothetical protein [Fibromonadaceae bacterium]
MKPGIVLIFCLYLGTAFSQVETDKTVPDSIIAAIDTLDTAIAVLDTLTAISDSITAVPDTVDYDTLITDSAKIKPGIHFFISVGAQFIDFKDRSKFQTLLENR